MEHRLSNRMFAVPNRAARHHKGDGQQHEQLGNDCTLQASVYGSSCFKQITYIQEEICRHYTHQQPRDPLFVANKSTSTRSDLLRTSFTNKTLWSKWFIAFWIWLAVAGILQAQIHPGVTDGAMPSLWKKTVDVEPTSAATGFLTNAGPQKASLQADSTSANVLHNVRVTVSPQYTGYASISRGQEYEENDTFSIKASAYYGYAFKGWELDGQLVSTQNPLNVRMGNKDLHYTALFEYNPSNPADPGANYWNAKTGELIADNFTPGQIASVIDRLTIYKWNLVKSLIIVGTVKESDISCVYKLSSCQILDLSRINGISTLSTFGSGYKALKRIILPDNITLYKKNVFSGCSKVTELVCHATVPPTLEGDELSNLASDVTIYVPSASVDLYKAAPRWKTYTIMPFLDDSSTTVLQQIKVELSEGGAADWNNLEAGHSFNVSGQYVSASNLTGDVYYSVDNGQWALLAEGLASGSNFSKTITATFVQNLAAHTIRLYAKDKADGRSQDYTTTFRDASSLQVNGISSQRYTGKPITFANLTVSDPSTGKQLTAGTDFNVSYANNTAAGKASLVVTGVYPYSISSATHDFYITPATLKGEVVMTETTFKYNGSRHRPTVTFEADSETPLEEGRDYSLSYTNNLYPGTASVVVSGKGNYQGDITRTFTIEKGEVTAGMLRLTLPDEDITYDGERHEAKVEIATEGVGACTQEFRNADGVVAEPRLPGVYTLSLVLAEGTYYAAQRLEDVHTFTITAMDANDWAALKAFYDASGNGNNWKTPWTFTADIASAGKLAGVTIRRGRVVALRLPDNGIGGRLAPEIFALSLLQELDLSGNDLTGDVPLPATAACANLQTLDLTDNALSGNIAALAAHLPALTTLRASGNCLTDVKPALPASVKTLELERQTITQPVEVDWQNISAEKLTAAMPSICLYDHAKRDYLNDFSFTMHDNADTPAWTAQLACSNGRPGITATEGHHIYKGENGAPLYLTCNAGSAKGSTFTIRLHFAQGDADFSGTVDVLDLQATINGTFNDFNGTMFNHTAANLIADDRINVQDVVALVNLLLAQDLAAVQQPGAMKTATANSASTPQAYLYKAGNRLMLHSPVPVAALDIILENAAGQSVHWNTAAIGMMKASSARGTTVRTLIYSLTGGALPAGETLLATLDSETTQPAVAQLADAAAHEVAVALRNPVTGMAGVAADGSCTLRLLPDALTVTTGETLHNVRCDIFGADGRHLGALRRATVAPGTTRLSLPVALAAGVYIVHLQTEGGVRLSQSFILSK